MNHTAPSGPLLMAVGLLDAVGIGNSLIFVPSVVIRPILFALRIVNHRAPSEPTAMPTGWAFGVGSAYICTLPSSEAAAT
jgi:hypothetical protein